MAFFLPAFGGQLWKAETDDTANLVEGRWSGDRNWSGVKPRPVRGEVSGGSEWPAGDERLRASLDGGCRSGGDIGCTTRRIPDR